MSTLDSPRVCPRGWRWKARDTVQNDIKQTHDDETTAFNPPASVSARHHLFHCHVFSKIVKDINIIRK